LTYTFINPNTEDKTIEFLINLIAEMMAEKLEMISLTDHD